MEAVIGGIIIGTAVSVFLLMNGRVVGISGIIGALLNHKTPDKKWRLFFFLGLISGGLFLRFLYADSFILENNYSLPADYIIAGLFVGFGTLMGNGCTSGHGVCGISRLSLRSIIATVVFIASGVLSVVLFKMLRGGI
jgi:uncharacterized protein